MKNKILMLIVILSCSISQSNLNLYAFNGLNLYDYSINIENINGTSDVIDSPEADAALMYTYNNDSYIFIDVQYDTVYTPNQSSISTEVYNVIEEFPLDIISFLDNKCSLDFPNATKLRNASTKYNCHSYSFYSQSSSNSILIGNPSIYINDFSYVEVNTPQIGDIIIYYNSSNVILHSGIVSSYNDETSNNICGNANMYNVISKWGFHGLYEHKGDECPYVYFEDNQAEYVKFYHCHNYNQINWNSYINHKIICNCGNFYLENHIVSSGDINLNANYARCIICGGSAQIGFSEINYYSNISESIVLPNGVIILSSEDEISYFNNSLDIQHIINGGDIFE